MNKTTSADCSISQPWSPLLRRMRRALRKSAVLLFAVLCVPQWLATPLQAINRYWTGANSANWSDPGNWSPSGVPQNFDNLYFGDNSDANRNSINDLTDLTVGYLFFVENDYQLDGNPLGFYWISGGANFNQSSGSHTITLNCPLIAANPSEIIEARGSGGIITENTGTVLVNGPITLEAGATLYLTAGAGDYDAGSHGQLYISGQISGDGDVYATAEVVSGHVAGVEFNGTPGNTFSGALDVDASSPAQIVFNKASGAVVTNRLTVKGNTANVNLAGPGQIGSAATIEVDRGGRLFLSGNDVTVGNLVLSNGAVDTVASTLDTGSITVGLNGGVSGWSDSDSATPTIKGHLNLNGVLPFNINGSAYAGLDLLAPMGSAGGFMKSGSAALLLDTNNTFTGAINVTQGILDVRNSNALGSAAGATTLSGNGSLTLRNVAITGETLYSEGTLPVTAETAGSLLFNVGTTSWGGPIQLDHNLVVYADNTTLSGPISGLAGMDFRNGTAILGGSSANTFSGTTLVRCPLLEFNKPTNVRALNGPLVVGGGSGGTCEVRWLNSYQDVYDVIHLAATTTLYADGFVNLNNHNEYFGPLTFNGGVVDSGPAGTGYMFQPITANPVPTSAIINGNLGLPGGADRVFIVGDGAADCDLIVNAVISGSPGTYFVKQGAGTMCLAGLNTFNAPTLLEGGILDINSAAGLGTWPGLIIFDGATLRLSGPGIATGGVEVVGAGFAGTHGAVEALPGTYFTLSGNVLLDAASTFNVGTSGGLTLNGVISGNGPLTKIGPGFMQFTGAGNNAYSGDTIVAAGPLNLAKNPNAISVPHNLVIGPASASSPAVARLFQTGGLGGTTVTVNANSLFDLNGYYQSLTTLNLRDGGSVQTGVGLLDFPSGGAINVGSLNAFGSHVSAAITGTLGLPPNATLTFNINPFAPFFPFASGPELDLTAAIPRPTENLSFAPAGITKNGDGQMRLSGNNTYAGSSFINDGTLMVDGTQPQSPILVNSGTLGGSGTVGHIYMSGGVVAPGDNGPGILTCSNLNAGISAGGTLRIELNGTTPGTGYDQLNVRGTVNLAGVALQRSLGFSPPTGAQFDIISNDGTDAVTGTFNGLQDGGRLYIGGVLYQINYRFSGRPGNDVALQGLDTPPPPTLTIERVLPGSVRLIWPTNDPPFSLQTALTLPATNWSAALPLPVVVGTNNVVTNLITGNDAFYRLSNP